MEKMDNFEVKMDPPGSSENHKPSEQERGVAGFVKRTAEKFIKHNDITLNEDELARCIQRSVGVLAKFPTDNMGEAEEIVFGEIKKILEEKDIRPLSDQQQIPIARNDSQKSIYGNRGQGPSSIGGAALGREAPYKN